MRAWDGDGQCCGGGKGSFGDLVDMGLEGEGGVKDDTQVADLGGWGDSGAINSEGEVLTGAGE